MRCKQEHGNPTDWTLEHFRTEDEALAWEQEMLAAGYVPDPDDGWHFGYIYSPPSHTHHHQGKAA